jgi:hypothetical protein
VVDFGGTTIQIYCNVLLKKKRAFHTEREPLYIFRVTEDGVGAFKNRNHRGRRSLFTMNLEIVARWSTRLFLFCLQQLNLVADWIVKILSGALGKK